MKGTHVLFISSWYPNRNDPSHGIFNRAFAKSAALHHRVSVLHVSGDARVERGAVREVAEEEGLFTVRIYCAAKKRLPGLFGKIVQHFRRMRAYKEGFSLVKERAGMPDIIHLNVPYPAGAGALALSRRYGIPYVMNECWTGYDPADGRYSGIFLKWFTRRIARAASMILPVSAYLLKLMQLHGLQGKYEVVPNVIDTDVFYARASGKPEEFTLIHVSALDDAQKNVSGIISAFLEARKRHPMRLVIVGEGSDAQALRKLAQPAGPAIEFTGRLSPAALSAKLAQASALVMFSNYETFCVAVPEALACGKPVITSDAGGIMSYFNDSLGIIVPRGDVEALAVAMSAMSQSADRYDPQYLRDFVVQRFTPAKVGGKLKQVYAASLKHS